MCPASKRPAFPLAEAARPVRHEVLAALDDALARLGGRVMHAIDPARVLRSDAGGPPVWSVGMVRVPGPIPYTLLVTYGLSHLVSPESCREGLQHEHSLAMPAGVPLGPWADALLRYQCRHVLRAGSELHVGDCVPIAGLPLPRLPEGIFPGPPLGALATTDPVLGSVPTPAGELEVRRLVCLDAGELARLEHLGVRGFLEELRSVDPLLLSPPARKTFLDEAALHAPAGHASELPTAR